MSLLNEMLKDLNQHKAQVKAKPLFVPQHKRSVLAQLANIFPWVVGSMIFVTLGALLWQTIKPHRFNHSTLPFSPPSLSIPEQLEHPLANAAPVMASVKQKITSLPSDVASNVIKNKAVEIIKQPHPLPVLPSLIMPVAKGRFQPLRPPVEASKKKATPLIDQPSSASVNKVFNTLTAKEWHDDNLNSALEAIEAGEDAHAIQLLDKILARFPDAMDARESLAALYLSRAEYIQARATINEGLQLRPNMLSLNTMKARLLFEQDKPMEALAILDKFHPDIRNDPDFYGLRAAVLQTLTRINEAGSIYKALVEIDPSNGQYWLGYGLALENKQATQQAIMAYKRVSQCYDIDPAVRTFAENRLKILQG